MEQRLKQRLVGASVLVLLVVVVVPELFDEDEPDEPTVTQNAAQDEDFTSRVVPLDDEGLTASSDSTTSVPESVDEDEPDDGQPGEAVERVAIAPSESTSQDGALIPAAALPVPRPKPMETGQSRQLGLESWVVQLASFSESERAVGLRDELLSNGYTAFIRPTSRDGKTYSRVFVGPETDKRSAEILRDRLLGQTKLKGQVVPSARG